jgi:hypothetical protein
LAGRVVKVEVNLRPRSVIMTRKKHAVHDEPVDTDDAREEGKPASARSYTRSGKARTTSEEKLLAFAEIICKYPEPRRLKPGLLIQAVATKLDVNETSVSTFWKVKMTAEQKEFLLYGARGK